MADTYQLFGGDLSLSASGDLLMASGPVLTTQRVLRRLLTNPTDDLWNLSYGAGLAAMVGQPVIPARIAAIVRAQMFQEATVARTPAPTITVQADGSGYVYLSITYVDAVSGTTQVMTLPVS